MSKINRELENLVDAIKQFGTSTVLQESLRPAEERKRQLVYDLAQLDRNRAKSPQLPEIDAIRTLVRQEMQHLARESQEFGRLMRQLVPEICVYPYRLIDGGQVRLRAHATLDVSRFAEGWADRAEVQSLLKGELIVDLFEPPQRERFREQVWRLTHSPDERLTERQIAVRLGITQPAVQYAKALQRELDAAGRTDAYVPVTVPIDDNPKLRRHKHPRFRFAPSPGFPRAWPTT